MPPTLSTTSTDMLRAAVYQRVSSNQQNDRRQDYENEDAVTRYGWQPTPYREPKGVSASRFGKHDREVWDAIRAGITSGQIDVVVVWEVSRAQRQLTGWSEVLDACRRHHVRIYVTSRDRLYDVARTDDWKALASDGIQAVVETEDLSTRVRSGKAQGRREHRPQGSIPYGIRRVKSSAGKWAFLYDTADPVTGPVAGRIIREVGAGKPYVQIARDLDRDAILSPRGLAHWDQTVILRIAGNGYYAEPLAAEGYEDQVTPVVTMEESLKARRRVGDGQRKGERPGRQVYRYTRVMRCSVCGTLVRGKDLRGVARYTCDTSGHANSISGAAVDGYIDQTMIDFLATDGADLMRTSDGSEVARYRTEAAGHRQKIKEATLSYNKDRLGITVLEEIIAFRKPLAEAAEKRAADAELPSALSGLPDEDRAVVSQRWEALTIAARKAAVRALAPGLTLMPGRDLPVEQRVIPDPR